MLGCPSHRRLPRLRRPCRHREHHGPPPVAGCRVPLASASAVACLDPAARRVALVLGSDRHEVAAHRHRARRPAGTPLFVGVTPLLTARRILRDQHDAGYGCTPFPQAASSRRSPAPPDVHSVSASPGGRHLALTTLDRTEPASRDRQWLADLKTGAVRPIEIAGAEIIGWGTPTGSRSTPTASCSCSTQR